MQSLEFDTVCRECSTALVDAGDEYVCPSCGVVREKVVLDTPAAPASSSVALTVQPLGSFLGSMSPSSAERQSVGFSRTNSTFRYLKLISDFSGREENGVYTCMRMIERVCDTLTLPPVVVPQAVDMARRILSTVRRDRRIPLAAVSVYSVIAACKMGGFTSVSSREIIQAHAAIGKHVKVSSVIRLSIEVPFRVPSRKPEEYLSRTLARLSVNEALLKKLPAVALERSRYFSSLRDTAAEILGSLGDEAKDGHRPCALAATAVYSAEVVLAFRESRQKLFTQRETSLCGDTAEYTVREQYRKIFLAAVERLRSEPGRGKSATTAQ